MATVDRPLSPHLQVYRRTYTMVLSIVHRATGLALSMGLLLVAAWLLALAAGPAPYGQLMHLLGSPAGGLAILGLAAAFWYHFCAGLRHLVHDLGWGLEKAVARRTGRVMVLTAAVLTLVTWAAVLRDRGHL